MRQEPHRFAGESMTLSEHASEAPLVHSVLGNGCSAPTNGGKSPVRDVAHFLRTLFRLLDESEIRYCVLHSWQGLPECLATDLDMAIHPKDKAAIPSILEALRQYGYAPYHWNNYIRKGHSFYFFWTTGWTPNTVAVDVIFEHRRAGMILESGEELVSGRVRQGDFWAAAPEVECAYLLAKKGAKGNASRAQSLRLKQLVEGLGREKAEGIAGRLFGGNLKTRIVEACASGSIDKDLGALKRMSWLGPRSLGSFRKIRYWLGEIRRAVWRADNPTGVLLAVMGPDGVGKSTVLDGLAREFISPLRRRHLFHWRPQLLGRRKDNRPVTDPHGQTPRAPLASMAYLSAFFVDCWAGYLFVVRTRVVRSGFVQFDRYFHDVLVDPRRYRYGGPTWFAALLCRLLPEPDLVIFLDANEDLIRTRKTELTRAEIQRQRIAYREMRFKRARQVYVTTDAGIEPALLASATAVTEFMKQRFNKRIRKWMRVA
jgi:thymidylate kinase